MHHLLKLQQPMVSMQPGSVLIGKQSNRTTAPCQTTQKTRHCLEIKGTGDTRSSCLPDGLYMLGGEPEPLHTMERLLGNSQISRTPHQVLEGKVLSKDLHSACTGDSWGRRLGFAAWKRHISVATGLSWWLTGETVAYGMCCTCADPFLWPEPRTSC